MKNFRKPNRKPTMSFSLDDFMYYVDFDERTINLYRKRKAEGEVLKSEGGL